VETSCLEGLVYPFISFTSIPLVVSNLILVYPPQSDCEKNLSFSVVERLVIETKSAIEGSTSGNAHVEVVLEHFATD
jgi:hypothetical protein